MTYTIWEYVTLIALVLLIICWLIMLIFGFTRNKYYHEFHQDELIKESKTVNSKNYLYFTSGETFRYIKKYVFCKTALDKYVIVNFNKYYTNISFFVLCYGANNRPIKVLKYLEGTTDLSSKIIAVPKNTRNVNIVISQVDGKVINYNVIKPLSFTSIKANAFFMFISTFLFLFVLRHVIFFLGAIDLNFASIDMAAVKGVLNSTLACYENYALIVISLIIGIITGIKAKKYYKKKSKLAMKGGTVEYDFN